MSNAGAGAASLGSFKGAGLEPPSSTTVQTAPIAIHSNLYLSKDAAHSGFKSTNFHQ
jgi:hypothetical protein